MRVLQVITGLGTGGAETQLRALVQHSRHESEVACLHNVGAVAEELRADGVPVYDLGMRSNRDVTALSRLARLMRRGRYDVVHTHLYRACLYGRVAAAAVRVPRVVATEHSLHGVFIEGRRSTIGIRSLYRISELLGDVTIAVSSTVRAHLIAWGVPADRITVVPNGIELDRYAFSASTRAAFRSEWGIPADAPVVGGVGRLHPQKDFMALLEACSPLLDDGAYLVIVGEGSERSRLRTRADELGVGDHVVLAGERSAIPAYSAMDVLASPAPHETFGMAIIEGLASGLPVVYRSSPALDQLGVRVPGATAIGGDAADLRAALDIALAASDRRSTAPPQLAAYDIAYVAGAVDAVYEGRSTAWMPTDGDRIEDGLGR